MMDIWKEKSDTNKNFEIYHNAVAELKEKYKKKKGGIAKGVEEAKQQAELEIQTLQVFVPSCCLMSCIDSIQLYRIDALSYLSCPLLILLKKNEIGFAGKPR